MAVCSWLQAIAYKECTISSHYPSNSKIQVLTIADCLLHLKLLSYWWFLIKFTLKCHRALALTASQAIQNFWHCFGFVSDKRVFTSWALEVQKWDPFESLWSAIILKIIQSEPYGQNSQLKTALKGSTVGTLPSLRLNSLKQRRDRRLT